jgi:hypothetical protein
MPLTHCRPRRATRLLAVAAACAPPATLPAAAQAFNPQPDPPGRTPQITSVRGAGLDPQSTASIAFLPPGPCRIS